MQPVLAGARSAPEGVPQEPLAWDETDDNVWGESIFGDVDGVLHEDAGEALGAFEVFGGGAMTDEGLSAPESVSRPEVEPAD
ncbi:MAG TPA: hypothetical protein VF711_07700, partial [Acidimicrobiales bacterium]